MVSPSLTHHTEITSHLSEVMASAEKWPGREEDTRQKGSRQSNKCLPVKVTEQWDRVGGTGRIQPEVPSVPLLCPEARASCQAALLHTRVPDLRGAGAAGTFSGSTWCFSRPLHSFLLSFLSF